MECVDQDPIEVILVFDEDGKQHYSTGNGNRRMDTVVTLPPQLTGMTGHQNYLGNTLRHVFANLPEHNKLLVNRN